METVTLKFLSKRFFKKSISVVPKYILYFRWIDRKPVKTYIFQAIHKCFSLMLTLVLYRISQHNIRKPNFRICNSKVQNIEINLTLGATAYQNLYTEAFCKVFRTNKLVAVNLKQIHKKNKNIKEVMAVIIVSVDNIRQWLYVYYFFSWYIWN